MAERKPYKKHWPRENLDELVRFLEERNPEGLNLHDLSTRLGCSCQNLSQLFVKDDMKLSRAEAIAKEYGYSLTLLFPQRQHFLEPSVRNREFPNSGNLAGLVKYLYDSNISINYMSQRIGRSNNVVTNAFVKGDILISTLYTILRNLKIDVIWEFNKL